MCILRKVGFNALEDSMRYSFVALALSVLSGCASVSSLPDSANEVNFDAVKEGKTGWSEYQETTTFPGVTLKTAFDAAKAGLADAGFALRSADFANGVVKGAHGMTAHDWNIVAGVYLKETAEGVAVMCKVEGSKDIGFSGDATSGGWTGEILKGMRKYILDLEARRPGTGVSPTKP
jgi:uncharacterized protein YceK